jgi:hypothetical protein
VHETLGANDPAPVRGPDALVTQADPEEGDAGAECPDHIAADPRFGRGARPGREDDPLGPECPYLVDADAVVPMDDHLQFPKVLDGLHEGRSCRSQQHGCSGALGAAVSNGVAVLLFGVPAFGGAETVEPSNTRTFLASRITIRSFPALKKARCGGAVTHQAYPWTRWQAHVRRSRMGTADGPFQRRLVEAGLRQLDGRRNARACSVSRTRSGSDPPMPAPA